MPVDGRYVVDLLPAMLLLGVGGGLAFPALMTLAMSGVAPEDSGLASGLVNTTQQVGGALGLAILASVAETAPAARPTAAALVDGYSAAFEVAAGARASRRWSSAVVVLRGRNAPVAARGRGRAGGCGGVGGGERRAARAGRRGELDRTATAR